MDTVPAYSTTPVHLLFICTRTPPCLDFSLPTNMSRRANAAPVTSSVLYVGLIPFDWDEETLKSVVSGSGRIVDVRLGFDYAGKNKGFCFIEYASPQEANRGMVLLGQVKIGTPGQKLQFKRLRIELSKEGFRAGASEQKQVLNLPRTRLPPNIQLPPEMMGPSSGNPGISGPSGANVKTASPAPVAQNGGGSGGLMPTNFIPLTLPKVERLPFEASDKISETLSQIPPEQLVQLIANLKNTLSGPDAGRAADVFQILPHLATAAAQALLLMGFIDNDVISGAMKSALSTPQPLGPYGQLQTPVNPKWAHLPPHTQAKLLALDPGQADLVVQVLSLSQDQFVGLTPDKQEMVRNIRLEYL